MILEHLCFERMLEKMRIPFRLVSRPKILFVYWVCSNVSHLTDSQPRDDMYVQLTEQLNKYLENSCVSLMTPLVWLVR